MRAIFMGKNKPSVIQALEYTIKKEIEIVAVVAPPRDESGLGSIKLIESAERYGLPVTSDEDLYAYLDGSQASPFDLCHVDLVLSFLFWKKIKKPLIDLSTIACLNFHPAPLPQYRGWGIYNFAILNGETSWGVTSHWVDEDFDTGDIVKVSRFNINPEKETAFSLEQRSQLYLIKLFKEIIDMIVAGHPLPKIKQSHGSVYTRTESEKNRRITPNDSLKLINRKIRAFWYPPYGGATIELSGEKFIVVNDEILREIGIKYHGQ